jgi:hypothetical protein
MARKGLGEFETAVLLAVVSYMGTGTGSASPTKSSGGPASQSVSVPFTQPSIGCSGRG